MKTQRHTLNPVEFAKELGIGANCITNHIRLGRIRAMNVGSGSKAASWLIPISELKRFRAAGYFPKKKMPVVVAPDDLERLLDYSKPTTNGEATTLPRGSRTLADYGIADQDIDKQITYHATELARLVDEKLTELADLSELATLARKLLNR